MAYEIIQIPSDLEGAREYVELNKAFRLLSLKTSPMSFGSSYEREIAFTDDVWLSRLTNPNAATFVAIQAGRILSALTILGPLPIAPEDLSPSGNPWELKKGDDLPISHWRINGMFTLPKARGQGIAKTLIQKALQYGSDRAEETGKEFVGSIVVDADNSPAKSLYQKCGFTFLKEEPFGAHGRTTTAILMRTK